MSTRTAARRTSTRSTSYGVQISVVLAVAFAPSAVHTVHSSVVGIEDHRLTVTTPAAWLFYLVGFGAAALARTNVRWPQVALLTSLGVLLVVAVFCTRPPSFPGSRPCSAGSRTTCTPVC